MIELSDCYKRISNIEKELETLFLILKNQIPGIECLNKIGDVFLRKKLYSVAIYWFELALESADELNIEYQKFISYISIGVCYYWLGDFKKANEFNEKAGKIRPNDSTYLNNKKYYM